MHTLRPSWTRIGGVLVSVILATTGISPTVALAAATPDKSETVHVETDAQGSVTSIRVDDLLANDGGAATLADASTLDDITASEDAQHFATSTDGSLTWTTGGTSVSYEGTSTKEPPVKVKVSYALDGAAVDPATLAGATGHLTIRVDYENTLFATQRIADKDARIYTPFVCMTAALLDGDVFANVQAENAKVIDDKGGIAVIGYAAPGLAESLDVDPDDFDLDLPEYLQIEADVTDLVLDPIYTIVTPELLSDLDTSELDFGDLGEGTGELSEAMGQLINGSSTLTSALQQAAGKAQPIKGGVQKLRRALKLQVIDGKTESKTVNELVKKLDQLTEVSGMVEQGSAALPAMAEGAQGAIGGASEAQEAAAQSVSGAVAAVEALQGTLGDEGLGSAASDVATAAAQAAVAARTAQEALAGSAVSGTDAVSADLESALAALEAVEGIDEDQKAAVAAAIQDAQSDLADVSATPTADDLAAQASALEEAATALESKGTALEDAVSGSQSAADEAASALAQASGAVAGVGDALDGASQALAPLATTAQATSQGAAAVSGALTQTSTEVDKAVKRLPELLDALDGLEQLPSGLSMLADGSAQLTSGLSTFNDEGITKIVDALNDLDADVNGLTDRLDALRDAARAYDNFSGKAAGQSGSVRFIYKTEQIG